ncbi:MAG: phage major capsid protein, partial [Pseudomonadota bacterium]|nr:phage major capsid protein [Pseudomonadota bacterium]
REHEKLFENWIRPPRDAEANRKLSEFQANAKSLNIKSVSIGTPADGGYAVPEEIGRDIERHELQFSPVRNLVKVSKASTSDLKRLLDLRGAEGGWRSESGSATETDTPTIREITPTGGEIYAYPKASNWSLEDVMFDVRNWLVESVAERFAQLEGQAVISGDGDNKPTGMLNTPPVATADDAVTKRAAAAYQYVDSSDNSPANVDADSLIDMVYTLNSRYRAGSTWAMNSATAGAVRKLKASGTGDYLWSEPLAMGQPPMLLGYPVALWEDLPDILGGNFPVAFGNFRRAYELIDRSMLQITIDPYTTPGFTKFYVRRRVYGNVSNNDALKFMRLL